MTQQAKRIQLTGRLREILQQDDLPAWMFKHNYDCLVNIIQHPEKFPKADFDAVADEMDAYFECDPVACTTPELI